MSEFKREMEEMNIFIEQTIQKLREMESGMDLHITITYISSLATNIKIEYTKAIDMIKIVIQNKLISEYTEVMTYKHLIKDLQAIEQEFDDTRVRLLTNPLELQNSITITGAIIKRKLLIELEVPIVDRNIYTLEKIIKLPMRDEELVFVFDIPHLNHLVQNEARLFIRKRLICYPQRETHFADYTSCESNILFDLPHKIKGSCILNHLEISIG